MFIHFERKYVPPSFYHDCGFSLEGLSTERIKQIHGRLCMRMPECGIVERVPAVLLAALMRVKDV
jgi:hypothetical protein